MFLSRFVPTQKRRSLYSHPQQTEVTLELDTIWLLDAHQKVAG